MRLAYIPFLLSLLLLFSCEGERVSTFSITSYNLYLLFDGTDDGDEFPPLSSSEGYGDEEYLERMDIYSSVFNDDEFLSDVLVFQEIESEEIVRDIALMLYDKGYHYYGMTQNDGPLEIAFISKVVPERVALHQYGKRRGMIELVFPMGMKKMSVFVVHLKSQIGEGSSEEREEEWNYIDTLLDATTSDYSMVIGDFNEDTRTSGLFPITGNIDYVSDELLYSAALDERFDSQGTYYYNGTWERLDDAFFSSGFFSGEFEAIDVDVLDLEKLADGNGIPEKYDMKEGEGYSDHFPIKVELWYH